MARKAVERNISYDDVRQLYYVSMELGRDENGKRIKQYRTFPTLTAARNGLRDFHTQRERQAREPQDEVREEMDLAHWLEYWMESIVRPNRAETTVYAYQKIIDNHILPALGGIPMSRLSAKRIQRYYTDTQQAAGLSSNTMRRHHDLLSSALRSAVRQDMLLASPMDRVEPPRSRVKEAFFYDNEELKQLYQLIEGHILELAVKMAGSLGMRREEICGLRWSSVDFELRKLHIKEARTAAGAEIVQKETKNRSSNRILHMSDDLYRLLRRERARQAERKLALGDAWPDTGMVAVDAKGNPYSPNAVSLAFTRFIQAHHLPKITLHGLRHTFATVASAQGAPLFDIGKALGHSTPATTGKIYTHLLDQNHTATLDRVANALK